MNGKGKEKHSDGSIYEGDFVDSKKTSPKGKIVWPDGSSYEGEWKDDEMEGKGKYIWKTE